MSRVIRRAVKFDDRNEFAAIECLWCEDIDGLGLIFKGREKLGTDITRSKPLIHKDLAEIFEVGFNSCDLSLCQCRSHLLDRHTAPNTAHPD